MTLTELQQQAHALACEKGWWDGERDPDEVFSNFHAEIAEAWEEYRSGRPITELCIDSHCAERGTITGGMNLFDLREVSGSVLPVRGKPTGFFVELADLVIRIADAAQALGMQLWCEADVVEEEKSVPTLVCVLHGKIQHARYSMEYSKSHGVAGDMTYAVELCFFFAKQHGIDLWKVIDLKHAYNATRPHKHGGKIA